MARRKGSHGQGEYAFPGGHLEYMEGFEKCAPKHYVDITLTAKSKNGEPINREPEKSEAWAWYSLDELPEPAFEMCSLSVRSYKSKEIYFDKI